MFQLRLRAFFTRLGWFDKILRAQYVHRFHHEGNLETLMTVKKGRRPKGESSIQIGVRL